SADPWVFQYLLPLEDVKSGDVVIFCTPSFGGRRAVADLCSTYAKRTKKTGCGQPIIKLATAEMTTKTFRKLRRAEVEMNGSYEAAPGIEIAPPTWPDTDDMNDSIPF